MLVQDFSHLVEIWKLVEKDPATKEIYLSARSARVNGMHVEADRRSPEALPIEKTVAVGGAMLLGTLALMKPDAVLSIKQTDASLILNAGGRRAVVRVALASKPPQFEKQDTPTFGGARLRDEVSFLKACTTGEVISPLLSGVRMQGKNAIILEATDAQRRTGRVTVKMPISTDGQVIPVNDLETALSLLSKKISLRFVRGHLYLSDRHTTIKLSLLNGKYPDLSRMPTKFKHAVTLHKSDLETAVRAAVLFDEDRIITLEVKKKKASLVISGQETGGFRQPIGKRNVPDIDIRFDAHWLDAASYIGQEIELRYNDAASPVQFLGSKRTLWLSPITTYRAGVEA